ncbi:MAG: iron dependent repressor, metal binding and dimerization domain protein, partial [Planctomycetota bacterium]
WCPAKESTAPPWLLVHSINAAASSAELAPLAQRLSAQASVALLDLPGFGDAPRPCHRYAIEDYVEAIDDMIRERGEARVGWLAKRFGVAQVTVTRVVARLRRSGHVSSPPRRPLLLSAEGRTLAARSRERHQVVLRFLLFLGVPRASAEIDAEGVEHHVSHRTLARFAELSGPPGTAEAP